MLLSGGGNRRKCLCSYNPDVPLKRQLDPKRRPFSNQIRAHLVSELPAASGITSSFGIH